METRNPIESYLGSKFPAICNHCKVMAAWSHKTLKNFETFLRFKRPLTVKFSKFCSERFHRDTDRRVVFKFSETWPTRIGEIVRCLPDNNKKFRLALQLLLLRGSCPQTARAAPDNVLKSAPDFIQVVHFRRRYSRTREHRQNAPLTESSIRLNYLASSRINMVFNTTW